MHRLHATTSAGTSGPQIHIFSLRLTVGNFRVFWPSHWSIVEQHVWVAFIDFHEFVWFGTKLSDVARGFYVRFVQTKSFAICFAIFFVSNLTRNSSTLTINKNILINDASKFEWSLDTEYSSDGFACLCHQRNATNPIDSCHLLNGIVGQKLPAAFQTRTNWMASTTIGSVPLAKPRGQHLCTEHDNEPQKKEWAACEWRRREPLNWIIIFLAFVLGRSSRVCVAVTSSAQSYCRNSFVPNARLGTIARSASAWRNWNETHIRD